MLLSFIILMQLSGKELPNLLLKWVQIQININKNEPNKTNLEDVTAGDIDTGGVSPNSPHPLGVTTPTIWLKGHLGEKGHH